MDYIIIKDSSNHKRSYDILIDTEETKLYIIGNFHFHLQRDAEIGILLKAVNIVLVGEHELPEITEEQLLQAGNKKFGELPLDWEQVYA